MEKILINREDLFVHIKTGSEGPSHDPYSYQEFYVSTPKGSVTIHEGLAHWCEVDKVRYNPATSQEYGEGNLFDHHVVEKCGFTPNQLIRIARKAKEKCPEGGHHETHEVDGHPGEYFDVCTKCGKVVDSTFYESAII